MSRITHLIKTQGLGLVALLLVLTGGAAYAAAAAKDSVSSRSIKDGQVKTRDLKDGAVESGKLAPGSVSADKIAPGSVPGDRLIHHSIAGAKITSDAITPDKVLNESLSGFEIAPDSLHANDLATDSVGGTELKGANVVVSAGTVVPPGGTGQAAVTCPAGQHLTGGGFAWQDNDGSVSMSGSSPSLAVANRWEVSGYVYFNNDSNTLYAWALCLQA